MPGRGVATDSAEWFTRTGLGYFRRCGDHYYVMCIPDGVLARCPITSAFDVSFNSLDSIVVVIASAKCCGVENGFRGDGRCTRKQFNCVTSLAVWMSSHHVGSHQASKLRTLKWNALMLWKISLNVINLNITESIFQTRISHKALHVCIYIVLIVHVRYISRIEPHFISQDNISQALRLSHTDRTTKSAALGTAFEVAEFTMNFTEVTNRQKDRNKRATT